MATGEPTPAQIEEMVKEFSEWEIGGGKFEGKGKDVTVLNEWKESSGRAFNLKNESQVRYIGYETQRFGVKLGYSGDATTGTAAKMARWFFRRANGKDGAVRYGEELAIGYGTKPSFYRYAHQTFGINLVNTDTPAYEWRLIGVGKNGQTVKTGDWVALWNDTEEGFVIYFDRNAGVDLGWPDSQRWEDKIVDVVWNKAKDAAVAYVKSYVGG